MFYIYYDEKISNTTTQQQWSNNNSYILTTKKQTRLFLEDFCFYFVQKELRGIRE